MDFDKAGATYKDFQVVKSTQIEELQLTQRELVHLPTGAKVLHLANDDPENVFCLAFRTLPDSSNGAPHILEHTVLCGSKRYPVKDPFFSMTRRSLNTFMNAFTGADFTLYPAASQVPEDFYHLLSVYMDAAFNPLLKELSFRQEGHRLEFTDPKDFKSPLEYRGIVFNEMKGHLSNPSSRLGDIIHEKLFPDLPYRFNYGGEPKDIPSLTYDQLLQYHHSYYHPSRCLFYFYGNIPLERHLDFIAESALKGLEKLPEIPPLPRQPRLEAPQTVKKTYPIRKEEDLKDKTYIALGWLTCHILEQDELLALSVLNILLMGTDACPLKMALLKSGLCKQASLSMDSDCSEIPVILTLKGSSPEHGEALEALILKTLEDIAAEGIEREQVENAIHQIEFHRSEISGDHYPFGLSLFMRSGLLKQHGGRPEDALVIHTLCERLRNRLDKEPDYLSALLKKLFIDNRHRVLVVLSPDPELGEQEEQEEKNRLQKIRDSLDDREKQAIAEQTDALAAFQKEQEGDNLDLLPKIKLSNVPEKARDYPLFITEHEKLRVYHHPVFTNKIVYASLIFDMPAITEEELPYAKLMTTLLPQLGCGGRSYVENLDYMLAHTGGAGVSLTTNPQANDCRQFAPYLFVHGKALHRKAEKLFPLLREMAESADFTDISRLKELIYKQYTGLESSLSARALSYAMNLALGGLDLPSRVASLWNGLDYYHLVKDLALHFDERQDLLIEKMEKLQNKLLCLENPDLVVTCEEKMLDRMREENYWGLGEIRSIPYTPWSDGLSIPSVPFQGRTIASPVAFTVNAFKTLSYTHPDTAKLSIAARLFDNVYLHTLIREQGGAYGVGAFNNTLGGNFCFYAGRDPNIVSTFDAFKTAAREVAEGKFTDGDLEEAKLEIVQSLDSPISPGSRGAAAYSWQREGRTLEARQQFRDRMMQADREGVIEAVKTYVEPALPKGNGVVFAGRELLEKENGILEERGLAKMVIEEV